MLTPQTCEKHLQEWIAGDFSDEPLDCPYCRELAEALAGDRQGVSSLLASVEVPPAPRIEFRPALLASSGHPRRISLSLLPILFACALLATAIAGVVMARLIVGPLERARTRRLVLVELDFLEDARVRLESKGPSLPEGASWSRRIDWSDPTHAALLENIPARRRLATGEVLDPFGHPYLLGTLEGRRMIYSGGPNGISEHGRGDDIPPRGHAP